MSNLPLFSIIIVSWNVADSLQRCLDSIYRTSYPNLEVILVDNASSDNSIKVVEKFMTENITLRKNNQNVGFPKAVNQGLSISSGDFILLLNPDTQIPPDFFQKSLAFFQEYPDAWLMGPRMSNSDGSSQGSVFPEPSVVNYLKEFWLGQTGLTSKYTPTGFVPLVVNAVSGGCMVFPRRVYEKIGPLTEQVFMYFEDLDYCRRVRRLGGKIYFNPEISIVHEHGQSSQKSGGKTNRYIQESSLWYNGWLKYHLINFIIRSARFLHKQTY